MKVQIFFKVEVLKLFLQHGDILYVEALVGPVLDRLIVKVLVFCREDHMRDFGFIQYIEEVPLLTVEPGGVKCSHLNVERVRMVMAVLTSYGSMLTDVMNYKSCFQVTQNRAHEGFTLGHWRMTSRPMRMEL